MRTYRGVDIFSGGTDIGTRWYARVPADWPESTPVAIMRADTLAGMRELINTYRPKVTR